ncbi:hypothetical protein FRB94_009707 [Tulasnella sp. JGI-2019a]|nr:hypothetical protein FRB93_006863 [Tulasnella sp. JGI-2019a]KAG8994671.1 hypothetical protein FRB94_009707 [Tulasnella sp. JGI-2019a]
MNHALKQLKYIIGGGILAYYLDIKHELAFLLHTPGWPSMAAQACIGLISATVLIFLYLLVVLPRFKGVQPDYQNWRTSSDLSLLVPLLTTSITSGWVLLLISLANWTRLNVLESIAGSIGSYALMFGLVGLIPVPNRASLSM